MKKFACDTNKSQNGTQCKTTVVRGGRRKRIDKCPLRSARMYNLRIMRMSLRVAEIAEDGIVFADVEK